MAVIIDGKAFAANLRSRLATEVAALQAETGETPGLSVVLVGEDPASQVYVRNKARQARAVGMTSAEHRLASDTPLAELLGLIDRLNADPKVHGILVQLPLSAHMNEQAVLRRIDPAKDVDGFHPLNVGLLVIGETTLIPCTPLGCLMLLKDQLGDLAGLRALVLGRSNIVGKPMAALLLRESCTVTLAHSRTKNLPDECRQADILVAAVGRPRMVQGDWIKPGATVIDVGINRIVAPGGKSRLVGDVDFDAAERVAGAITPVPGGVGPMTIACLLYNTLRATQRQMNDSELRWPCTDG